ncbi:MAG: hypothetical protein JJU22_15065 [Gammaproteobacteria bacterium]|nr:hypothetical protein [Gammaproteobacteria bacterium]
MGVSLPPRCAHVSALLKQESRRSKALLWELDGAQRSPRRRRSRLQTLSLQKAFSEREAFAHYASLRELLRAVLGAPRFAALRATHSAPGGMRPQGLATSIEPQGSLRDSVNERSLPSPAMQPGMKWELP